MMCWSHKAHDSFSVQVNNNLDGRGTKRAFKSNWGG